MDSYETSYGEGYWTGALYIVRSLIGLALSSSPSSTAPLINIILDLVTIVISLVMIILASLNIVYTPYDISYLYHGVSMLTLCVVTVLTYFKELTILLTLYYTLLACGVLAAIVSVFLSVMSCISSISNVRDKNGKFQ